MKKIVTIIGARPQFVKAAVVSRAFSNSNQLNEVIIHTGQHFDKNMSDIFFDEMQIPKPNYNLNINGLGHGAMTGQMLEGIEKICIDEKPDYVLVYGDTNSTLAGALAAKKLHINIAHVEAGLRSFNMRMPEEINRILTDRISDILFCPTETAINNLKREGYANITTRIVKTGDVMYDAAMFYAKTSEQKSTVIKKNKLNDFVLCTLHRAENTDDINNLKSIFSALNKIAEQHQIVVPIHPRTKKIIEQNSLTANFLMIEPVGYFDMIELLKNCNLVMTDSGGLQKEAYFFNKNCVTLRTETEWVELVENGYNIIVGADEEKILAAYSTMLNKENDFKLKLYGNADAGNQIVNELLK
ncbi:MAG: hypothetical protein RIQ33_42 [Bacteroidota bacterium]|jgi:UDP-GlcNAc3NAcA epimerase